MSREPIDVAIVGGGPIGLELAVACKKSNLSYRVLEAGQIGNTIAWWASQTRWFSSSDRIAIAGVPIENVDQTKTTREQYLAYLRSVVRQFDLEVSPFTKVQSIGKAPDGVFEVALSQRPTLFSRNVVLAIGGTDIPNSLNIPGEKLPHVDSYFREPHRYFQRKLVIIGGRNSAVEAALRAHHCGAEVTLCYRGDDLPRQSIKYWLLPEIDGLIRAGAIRAYFNVVPTSITSSSVTFQQTQSASSTTSSETMETFTVPADDVLTLIGYRQDKQLFKNSGVHLIGESQRPEFDENTMMTNVPQLYVAGTAIAGTQSSKYKIFLENCHVHVERIMRSVTGGISQMPWSTTLASGGSAHEFQAKIEAMPES